ncbi:YqcC family protein [Alteromonas sp. H39]|uniref:YqcC family protein n=1 Tax=Alteromonas sp. H39 TaxID=3389876 RepID=UPI0039E12FE7
MDNALALLNKLEVQLKREALWSEKAIGDEPLKSQVPFAADTMAFEQWLQFIYLPRLRDLIHKQHTLPRAMQVAPAAEVYLPEQVTIIQVLRLLDALAAEQP